LYNHFCSEKPISVTRSKLVSVALFNQHAMRTRYIVICGLFGSKTFFHIISLTEQRSGKTVTQPKRCILIFYTNFVKTFLSLRRTERDLIKNLFWSSRAVNFTLYSYHILILLQFSRHICGR
jgi:hypothetical protein